MASLIQFSHRFLPDDITVECRALVSVSSCCRAYTWRVTVGPGRRPGGTPTCMPAAMTAAMARCGLAVASTHLSSKWVGKPEVGDRSAPRSGASRLSGQEGVRRVSGGDLSVKSRRPEASEPDLK
eukprot:1203939-Pyramimonas_sp.AAC.1